MLNNKIEKLYKEIIVLREDRITLRNQLKELDNKHSEKMNEINSLRKKDEKYVWCRIHDKKHNINVISTNKHRIQPIYDECLFPEDHIWIPTGVKKWFQPERYHEDVVDIYGEFKCMTCELITYRQVSFGVKRELPEDIEELIAFEEVDFGFIEEMLIG